MLTKLTLLTYNPLMTTRSRHITTPRMVTVGTKVSVQTKAKLIRLATRERRNISFYVAEAIAMYLKRRTDGTSAA